MSMVLMMSALGAFALTSGIALTAGEPPAASDDQAGDMMDAPGVQAAMMHYARPRANGFERISAAGRFARVAMRERVERI